MKLRYGVLAQHMIDEQNKTPSTTKYEKENFKNMNIFNKMKEIPNKKNVRITERIRKVVRDKVIYFKILEQS